MNKNILPTRFCIYPHSDSMDIMILKCECYEDDKYQKCVGTSSIILEQNISVLLKEKMIEILNNIYPNGCKLIGEFK